MLIIYFKILDVFRGMSIPIIPRLYYLCTKKLFERPVETDFAKEKAFTAAKFPFFFQIFLRIRFFDIEVRFLGTAIKKKGLLIFIIVCERHVLFKMNYSF
uniref:Ribosomal protein L32 n=1 Tax=Curcuma singularis TaxID=1051080 RepID=A0A8F3CH99_9LILI|nr:ribosomal protein L32 [Curcuma singularis]